MNITPTTSKGEQAKSQLIAAALAQFGEYGLHATTRDIAAQAGQNIAAITYYFGSKEDLYLACAQSIADFIGTNFRPHIDEASRLFSQPSPDRAAIRQLILNACHNMIRLLTHDDTLNLSKFISREQLSPLRPISWFTIRSLPRCTPTWPGLLRPIPGVMPTIQKPSCIPTPCWAKCSPFVWGGKLSCYVLAGHNLMRIKPRRLARSSPVISI
jgi:AcrR family transcriptional regulator